MRAGLILGIAMVVSGATVVLASGAEPGPELPPGPGRDVTAQACLGCHGADTLTRRRLSPADWKDMVDLMVNYGAMVDDKQKAEIVDYLSRALPPLAAAPDKGPPAPPVR
jgi:mono/diheme cytochrome c family protein